jgi:hypothetical protein
MNEEAYGPRMVYERRIRELIETLMFALNYVPLEEKDARQKIRQALAEETRW